MNPFIGLIGAGYWGKNLIREFYNLNILHTICDLDSNILERYNYQNLNKITDWQKLLTNPDISAIVIALPAELHHQFGIEALQANKDIFIEKPLALSIDHCQELIQLAKKKNKILMVGHLLQYHSAIEKIYQLIEQDYIGQIRYITSNRLNLGKIRKEENVLWSFAPHDISVILHLMKNQLPTSVICHGQSFLSSDIHDITNTILKFGDNQYVQINVNWLNPFKEQKMTIVGTKGMITFDDTSQKKNEDVAISVCRKSIFQNRNIDFYDFKCKTKSCLIKKPKSSSALTKTSKKVRFEKKRTRRPKTLKKKKN